MPVRQISSRVSAALTQRTRWRSLADHLWRVMITDERRQAASLGGHLGAALQSSAAGTTPTTSSSDKSLPRPANHDSTTTKPAA